MFLFVACIGDQFGSRDTGDRACVIVVLRRRVGT
jgi:hypothetical protein